MKNKILFLLHLPPPTHGSSMVGSYINNSSIINHSFSCDYINLMASKQVKESGKIKFTKIVKFIGIWFKLLTKLILKRPNLCYLALTTTGPAFKRDILLVTLLKLFRIKRVYHLHNKGIAKNGKSLFKRLLYRYIFKDVNVILLSKYLYSDISRYVQESNVYICPNGIPELIKKPHLIKRDPSKIKILFLSNLIESKGVFLLIESCHILKDKGISFECDFIGGEGDINTSQFNKLVYKYELENHVNYRGKKFGHEKEMAYRNADIFVFPTNNDCLPLVILEAMQNELPILSTTEGGIRDLVDDGETGFLIEQHNIILLTSKIEELITNAELRQRMGKAGRKKYENEFTKERFEKRLTNILYNILNQEIPLSNSFNIPTITKKTSNIKRVV